VAVHFRHPLALLWALLIFGFGAACGPFTEEAWQANTPERIERSTRTVVFEPTKGFPFDPVPAVAEMMRVEKAPETFDMSVTVFFQKHPMLQGRAQLVVLADAVKPTAFTAFEVDGIRQEWAVKQYGPDLAEEGKVLAQGKSPDLKDGGEVALAVSVKDREVRAKIEGEAVAAVKAWGNARSGHVGLRGWCLKAPSLKQAGVTCDSCCLYRFSGFDLEP
jgi:hypothetical protein